MLLDMRDKWPTRSKTSISFQKKSNSFIPNQSISESNSKPSISGIELYNEIKRIDPNVRACFLTESELYRKEF